jgi:hypothetical protein
MAGHALRPHAAAAAQRRAVGERGGGDEGPVRFGADDAAAVERLQPAGDVACGDLHPHHRIDYVHDAGAIQRPCLGRAAT